jgi:hypothetical protein
MEQILTTHDIRPSLARMRAEGEIDSIIEEEWTTRIEELLTLTSLAPCFAPGAKIKAEACLFDEHGTSTAPTE